MTDHDGGYPAMGGHPGWKRPEQPGIVPIRPLDLGDLYGGAFAAIRRNPAALIGISLAAAAVTAVLTTVLRTTIFDDVDTSVVNPADLTPAALARNLIASLSVLAVSFLSGVVASATNPVVVMRAVRGQPTSAGEALRLALPKVWRLLGVFAVLGVITLAGLVLVGILATIATSLAVIGGIALFIGLVYLFVAVTFSTAAVMIDDQRPMAAIKRSLELTGGSWWRLFGILLLTGLIVAAVGSLVLLGGVQEPTLITTVLSALISAVTTPFFAGVVTLMYLDQRIRREQWVP